MKRGRKTGNTVLGALFLFLSISAMVLVAVAVFSVIHGRVRTATAVVIMTVVTLALSALYTVIDTLRRKYTIERTVSDILAATDAIAKGDFSMRLNVRHPYRRYDEFDYIIENLNKMAAELSHNEMLGSDFISNVSHELKTPLAVIRTYATALSHGGLDDETRQKYTQTIVDTSNRLTDLIVNILKLNKLENKKITPKFQKVRLDESIARVVIGFEEPIEQKNITLDCDLDEIEIYSLPDYLEIVWNNLISNAIKFTDAGGSVFVSLKEENGKAVIKVRDTGCGISKETGARIFDKFYQGDTSHSKEGNGLGLALVKKVIDITGGDIFVESEAGKGTCFTVRLSSGGEA